MRTMRVLRFLMLLALAAINISLVHLTNEQSRLIVKLNRQLRAVSDSCGGEKFAICVSGDLPTQKCGYGESYEPQQRRK